MTIIHFGNHMAPNKDNNDSPKKRIIEFDMFVRDLEPEQDETIRAGGKSANQYKPDDRKTDRSTASAEIFTNCAG